MKDFDRRQFRLFFRLLSDLGARRELVGQFGFDQRAVMLSGGFGVLIGGLFSLAALADPPARGYFVFAIAVSALMLLPQLVSQAADAFMNPAEVSVLAHRPIYASSYLAAKAVFVVRAALIVTLPLNVIPALAGATLPGTRWFYPITHLAAVSLGAVFTAFVVCGVFGLLFGVLPIARVRTAALWVQLIAVTVVPFSPQLIGHLDIPLDLDARAWSAVPVTWFAAIGLVGQPGRPPLDPWLALPALAVAVVFIVIGVRSLTQDYMTHASTMMRMKSGGRPLRRTALRHLLPRIPWPGGQTTRAGTAFVGAMAVRDWQFRRTFLTGSVGIVVLLGIGIGRRFAESPLEVGGRFNPLHVLPFMLGILMLNASMALAFTDRPAAKWIFALVSARGLRGIVRGMYWGLWRPLVAMPHAILFAAGAVFWGLRDAALFSTYSLAIASMYLGAGLWLADGLPFTKPADPKRSQALMGVMLTYFSLPVGSPRCSGSYSSAPLAAADRDGCFRSGGLAGGSCVVPDSREPHPAHALDWRRQTEDVRADRVASRVVAME